MKKILLVLALAVSANLAAISNSAPSGNALVHTVNGYGVWPAAVDASGNSVPAQAIVSVTNTAGSTSRFAMAPVTYASSVQGTSMAGLTITSMASFCVYNKGSKPLNLVFTNSSTAPTNTATVFDQIPAGQNMCYSVRLGTLSGTDTVVHWWNDSTETVTNCGEMRY